jgi:hypothetical protein
MTADIVIDKHTALEGKGETKYQNRKMAKQLA